MSAASKHPDFREYKAPSPPVIPAGGKSVFLAGSIEMGKAIDWQTALTTALSHLPITVLNPRRDDWDQGWEQDIANRPFKEQVDWELDCQERATVVAMYFDKDTKAPISLLELGLFARSGRMVVCCPKGFWRRGNVQIVCDRFGIELLETSEELVAAVIKKLKA